jgi:hypothetical protein
MNIVSRCLRRLTANAAGVAMAREITDVRRPMMRLLMKALTQMGLSKTSRYHRNVRSVKGQLMWVFPEKEL